MKKTISFTRPVCAVLAPSLLAASLIACTPANDPNHETDTSIPAVTTAPAETESESVTEFETEAPAPVGLDLTAEVSIYCPSNLHRAITGLAETLAESIQEKTGILPTIRMVGDGTAPASSEIIIGFDDEIPATAAAYAATPVGSHAVCVEGNHVVLAAWTEKDLSAAADLFIESSLVQYGDRWIITPQATRAASDAPASFALSAYRIVYGENADDSIKNTYIPNLQAYLKEQYGIELQAVSDATPPTEHELVIGATNRTTEAVKPYLEGASAIQAAQRAIIPDGNKFFILGSNATAISLAMSHLLDNLETHNIGKAVRPHELAPVSLTVGGDTYVSDPMITEDKTELAEGATLRIMSYNILNQDYVPNNPLPPERDERFADVLLYYKPDVVGVQEANLAWHESFDMLFAASESYLPACRYHDGTHTAQTTFLYNPQTVKLVEEYVVHYTDWEDSDIRVVSIAVFETLADGKRFVMTNTHPAPHAEYYSGHMIELNRILTDELAKYEGLPVLMTGDFNTREYQGEYNTLMITQNVRDARYDEGVELVRDICTYTSLPSGEAIGGTINQANNNNIDHIFINNKVQAKLFNVIVDHGVENISDHLPIYADISLK